MKDFSSLLGSLHNPVYGSSTQPGSEATLLLFVASLVRSALGACWSLWYYLHVVINTYLDGWNEESRNMPPHADALLEERILKAAQRLWRTRGEHGLTLRAVAKEAGSTTPTVYKRFLNKQALLKALAERVRSQMNEHLFASKSIEDVCRRYLAFVEEHPHEYQLLLYAWSDVFNPELPRPGRAWLLAHSSPIVLGESPSATRVSFTPCCSCRTDRQPCSVFPARRTPAGRSIALFWNSPTG